MVIPSLPIYLDPSNWSQQQPIQQGGIGTQNSRVPTSPPPPPPPTISIGGGGGSYQDSIIRSGSIADRARLAKIHQPDASLKCPRCESTNTKFCYYNNYSLSQPRHFCKTCRRYWTRGGALRNVPVGGGCRRNKRSKGNNNNHNVRAKSPMKGASSTSANSSSSGCTNNDLMGHLPNQAQTQLPFFPTLHHQFNENYGNGLQYGTIPSSLVARNNGISSSTSVGNGEFQIRTNGCGSLFSNGIASQWRLPSMQQVHHQQHQQIPFLSNLETQIGLFQVDGENNEVRDHGGRLLIRSKEMESSSVSGILLPPQVNTIKNEENHQGLSLSKNLLESSGNNDLFWNGGSGNAWSEVPSFTSSSTSHLL